MSVERDHQHQPLRAKLDELRKRVRALESVVVCFSGGLDSGLVLAVAHEQLGDRALALTAVGPALAPSEHDEAQAFTRDIGVAHVCIDAGEILVDGYVANGPDRCFHCKTALYVAAERIRGKRSFKHVANGTNVDDLGDYRPGLEAAKNASVVSPLLDAGLGKAEIREAAREMGLGLADKPAAACLASRIPYGTSVTAERLAQVAGLELEIKAMGFAVVRVRHHDVIARIEVDAASLPRIVADPARTALIESAKRHGFTYVTLDLQGYRTGSHNELLDGRRLRTFP